MLVDPSEVITHLTIRAPIAITRARGIHSTTSKFAILVISRMTKTEVALIDEEAKRLSMSRSLFVRASALQVAKAFAALRENREAENKDGERKGDEQNAAR